MTYKDAITYLESFIDYEQLASFDYGRSLRLDRMQQFADLLGNPHRALRCIHITGTKGKGSTAAMVAAILKEAGFRVGLYTSPHLVSFRERIRINDEWISEEELCGTLERIRPIIDDIDKAGDLYPTFFEVYTALAFSYFKEKAVDFTVLEVGMGGRLDATNIIERPLCCGITQISYEHTQRLGNTLREIATEKAGIIKENTVCVSSLQEEPVRAVLEAACSRERARYYEVGKDLYLREEQLSGRAGSGRSFSVWGIFGEYPMLEVGLLGDHQFMNAATAIGLVESLRFYDIIIKSDAIRAGLRNVQWSGRLQVIQRNPTVVVDGAQNRASARALKEAIQKHFRFNRVVLVLGISKDKDIPGICEELEPISDVILLTRAKVPRAEEPAALKRYIKKEALVTCGVDEALGKAEALAAPNDVIVVTGSLYVVGEAIQVCQRSVSMTQ